VLAQCHVVKTEQLRIRISRENLIIIVLCCAYRLKVLKAMIKYISQEVCGMRDVVLAERSGAVCTTAVETEPWKWTPEPPSQTL